LYADLGRETFDPPDKPIWQYLSAEWQSRLCLAARQLENLTREANRASIAKLTGHFSNLHQQVDGWIQMLSAQQSDRLLNTLPDRLETFPRISTNSPDRPVVDQLKATVDPIKEEIKKLLKEMRTALSPEAIALMRDQTPWVNTFLDLTCRFWSGYNDAKTTAGRLDFDDLQALALATLNHAETPNGPPVAENYRRQFKFVMVDEYQDVNELQDAIVRAACRKGSNGRAENLLVVGDVKQSIYRFRLAEPEIFQRLCRSTDVSRIDLRENFRSSQTIIDTVNALFETLLVGGPIELKYDEPEKLIFGRPGKASASSQNTELLLLERDFEPPDDDDAETEDENVNELAELETVEREAYLVAQRIKALIDSKLTLPDGDNERTIRPDDIVILLRSLKFTANAYIAMLRRFGLDAHCEQVEAFLEYPEIADIVALLEIIDNPYQDIPLVTVLRSGLVGLSPDELARIRLTCAGPFYRAIRQFEQSTTQDDPTRQKVTQFGHRLDGLRREAAELGVGELVQAIYHRTGYRHLVAAGRSGEYRRQNLEQFLELAHAFSRDRQSDFQDFIEYLNLLRDANRPISTVRTGGGKGVRLMSIHASKGLEFPVVVVANLGKRVNLTDSRRDILIDRHLTIGLKTPEPDATSKSHTPATLAIAKAMCNKTIAEELRLLYVAMTRAREKLILSGSEKLNALSVVVVQGGAAEQILPSHITRRTSATSWLAVALCRLDPTGELAERLLSPSPQECRLGPITLRTFPTSVQAEWRIPRRAAVESRLSSAARTIVDAALNDAPMPPTQHEPDTETLLRNLQWKYSHRACCQTPAAFPVTELVRTAELFSDDADPAELGDSSLLIDLDDFDRFGLEISSAQLRGLIWHRFMEKLDLTRTSDDRQLREQLAEMIEKRYLRQEHAALIDLEQVGRFFRTVPGRIMLDNISTLYRELPFSYAMPAADLPGGFARDVVDETVLIRGIVDCLARTPDGLVIIDYKTNQITSADVDVKTNQYRPQIELYARALYDILNVRISSAWLYFTEPDSAVQVI
jgi:ATP-dependent helicase/nuclease subunit A